MDAGISKPPVPVPVPSPGPPVPIPTPSPGPGPTPSPGPRPPVPVPVPSPGPVPVPGPGPPGPGPPIGFFPPAPLDPTDDDLHAQFLSYFLEGRKKGFIGTNDTAAYRNVLSQWTIEPNDGQGDCFFESLVQCLNNTNRVLRKNKIIVPAYIDATTGEYSVSSIRRALGDFIISPAGDRVFRAMLVAVNNALDSLKNPFDPVEDRYRFMVDDDNNILPRDVIAERMTRSANPRLRAPGEMPLNPREYYWADVTAVALYEFIFGIKINLVSTTGIGNGQNGALVQYRKPTGEIITGTLKNVQRIGRKNNHRGDIETDEYITEPGVKLNALTHIERYSIYCHDTEANLENVDKFIFMLYSNENHFEALYMQRAKPQYVFAASEIPSYLMYMIFESCYRPIPPPNRAASTYGNIRTISVLLNGMIDIHNAKIVDPTKMSYAKKKILINGGGRNKTVKKRGGSSGNIIQSGGQNVVRYYSGYDSNYTYYIVIDLELYPGETIPMSAKASLACQIKYEKIRQSYADLFGYVYQPKELQFTDAQYAKLFASKNKTQTSNSSSSSSSSSNNGNYTRRPNNYPNPYGNYTRRRY